MAAPASTRAFGHLRSVKCAFKSVQQGVATTLLCRSYSGGGPRTSTSKGSVGGDDDVVKQAFSTQQKRFRTYLEEISKQKLDFDPASDASLKTYYHTIAKIRDNLGVNSMTVKIAELMEAASADSPDVRSFLEQYRSFRIEVGIEDDLGADKMMFAALDKVENNIKKRLTRDNADGMSSLKREFDQINQKLKLNDSELEQMEDEAEWALAKAELQEIQSVALEKMNTFKRRDDLKVDVDLQELDYRTCL